ncbi:MAG: M1 family metallopeptidase [Myxococcota bacterium]
MLTAGLGLLQWVGREAGAQEKAAAAQDDSGATPAEPSAEDGASIHAAERVDYTLEAKLDVEAHTVEGRGRVVWQNRTSSPQSALWLHLYLNAFASGETVFYREDSGGFRGKRRPVEPGSITVHAFVVEGQGDRWPEVTVHSPGDERDATDIRVPLSTPIEPGAEIAIEMRWTSHLPPVTFRTGYAGSFHMVAQWFPKLARLEPEGTWRHFTFSRFSEFYADYGRYDVTIDAPEGFVVGGGGRRVERSAAGGRVRHRFVADPVHDFSFAAWDRFAELKRDTGGVALRCLYPDDLDPSLARLQLDEVEASLEQLGRRFGPYPYPTLTVVHPPPEAKEAGGMEYPTLITTGGSAFWHRLGGRGLEGVTVHELAHQWFYGLLASDENQWPFLDEGLTTYATAVALEERYPHASGFSKGALSVGMPAALRMAAAGAASREIIAQSAASFVRGQDYGALVYSRTATLLLTMSRVYGPEKLEAALRDYTARFRFGRPRPEDLERAVGRHLGQPARRLLHRALFSPATVDYTAVEFRGDRGVVVQRRGELAFPVEVELVAESGARERVQWDGVPQTVTLRASRLGDARLRAAIVDPDHRVLLDQNLTNNQLRRRPRGLAPRLGGILGAVGFSIQTMVAP